jgi:hypothetical protein
MVSDVDTFFEKIRQYWLYIGYLNKYAIIYCCNQSSFGTIGSTENQCKIYSSAHQIQVSI